MMRVCLMDLFLPWRVLEGRDRSEGGDVHEPDDLGGARDMDKIVAMRDAGLSTRQIADRMKVPRSTIMLGLKRAAIADAA